MKKPLGVVFSGLAGAFACYILFARFFSDWDVPLIRGASRGEQVFTEGSPSLPVAFFAILVFFVISAALHGVWFGISRLRKTDVLHYFQEIWDCFAGKKNLQMIMSMILCVVAAACCGTALLWAVYTLPVEPIDRNVEESAYVYREEGAYPKLYTWCHSQLDNWTDSIMLLEAANDTRAATLERAMLNQHSRISEIKRPCEGLVAHYVEGTPFDFEVVYPRYWHGYLVILKPLLSVMDLRALRILNGSAQTALMLIACGLMLRKREKGIILPFLITWLMLMPAALAKCLQFSTCYYISVIGTIAILLNKGKMSDCHAVRTFLFIGIATAYFDFLAYPVATFGIPAIVLLAVYPTESAGKRTGKLVRIGLGWCFGYAGMWTAKWVVGSVLTGSNVIADAIQAVSTRTSHVSVDGTVQYTVGECIVKNVQAFFRTPFSVLIVLFLAVAAGFLAYQSHRGAESKEICPLPYALVAILPFAWYAFALNHSIVHYWFTNKALAVFVMAVLCGASEQVSNYMQGRLGKTSNPDETCCQREEN